MRVYDSHLKVNKESHTFLKRSVERLSHHIDDVVADKYVLHFHFNAHLNPVNIASVWSHYTQCTVYATNTKQWLCAHRTNMN